MTDLGLILRSLLSRRFVTVTTLLTVAVSVALMLMLLTLREAGREAFRRGSGTIHLLVGADSSPLVAVLNGLFYANPPRNPIPWAKYLQIKESFPWEWAIPTQLGDSVRGQPVVATTIDYLTRFQPDPAQPWTLAQGRFFEAPFEAVLGAEAARSTRLRVGSKFVLTHGAGMHGGEDGHHGHDHADFPCTVVGILEPTGTPHDRAVFVDLETSWIVHAHDRRHLADHSITTTTAADLLDEDRLITGILLRLPTRAGGGVPPAIQQQFDLLRRDTSIVVAQPEDQVMRLFAIVGAVDQLFIAMAAVVMIAGAVGIMLALASSMETRRRQIALMRVLGCSRPRIFSLVLTESAIMGFAGAVLGVVLGIVGSGAAALTLRRTLGLVINPDPRLNWILVVVALTVVLSIVAGIAPAAMAYRTSVARALRPMG